LYVNNLFAIGFGILLHLVQPHPKCPIFLLEVGQNVSHIDGIEAGFFLKMYDII
jgi:hypothetical protein